MPEQNLDVITQVYRAFATRDFGVIDRLFHPDIELVQTALLPWGGRYHGHQGAVAFFTTLLHHIESEVDLAQMFSAGDDVIQVGRTQGKTVATGTPFDVAEVHVWHLRDGKVSGFEAYIDTPPMLAALGEGR